MKFVISLWKFGQETFLDYVFHIYLKIVKAIISTES